MANVQNASAGMNLVTFPGSMRLHDTVAVRGWLVAYIWIKKACI